MRDSECYSCAWYRVVRDVGECHLAPPVVVQGDFRNISTMIRIERSLRPRVEPDDTCGQWKDAEANNA